MNNVIPNFSSKIKTMLQLFVFNFISSLVVQGIFISVYNHKNEERRVKV